MNDRMRRITNLLAMCFLIGIEANLPAQSSKVFPSKESATLNEQQVRGEGLFLQRCSVCHLPQARRQVPNAQPYGPYLNSVLKNSSAEKEKAIREIIMKGGQRMPGFQYGLTSKETDDLIAYPKTL
jgi:mono/diheme cytochrome c family protein